MEWSIKELARAAGVTSRTLRHYGQVGLLTPSRIGSNGYRYYDRTCLVRLQRILLLRDLGLGLPAIGEVLTGEQDTSTALGIHLELLEQEQQRIQRQIDSVRTTLRKTEGDEELMVHETFDGFDHSRYEGEVVQRWGRDAWDSGNRWWTALGPDGQAAHYAEHEVLAAALGRAAGAGLDPAHDDVQALVARHHRWVSAAGATDGERYLALGHMYVDDVRFAATYDAHGPGTAVLLRDAIALYVERDLD
ncbi:MAG: TipAS antibiotic-recognition domain-containing protein [Geodermatophilaceae bacterium]|nr:TipAS antibiotic-recognition domain-containing protein [Geodermatophilaceae bacterium]